MEHKPENIDQYIEGFPKKVQSRLQHIRETVTKAAPQADEVISYGMPAFRLKRILVYFAVFKNHIGFFPTSSGITAFRDQLQNYKTSRGGIQFPHNKTIPYSLIKKIVKYRLKEDSEK